MTTDDELLAEFLKETRENLDRARAGLARLAQDPSDRPAAVDVFRGLHTLAGTAGFFGFEKLGGVAHDGEKLLSGWRDGQRPPTGETRALAREVLDAVGRALEALVKTGKEPLEDFEALQTKLRAARAAAG